MFVSISAFLLVLFQILWVNSQTPEVEIPQGKLIGGTRTNRDGGTYYAFKSIPFGQPPLGDLRFKASLPALSWNGTLNATSEVPECASEEDCLYLNLYTPGLPSENVTNLPVMVFIYGGAFTSGSASESSFGAQYLLTKDVILVAANYRVGVFGFLSLDDSTLGVTGNAGLKDQNLALKWVQENIAYFGGDPNDVLLFGQSAGSMSTHLHIMSSTSNGLFHKAIMESGVSLSNTTTPAIRNNAIALAEYMGIQTDDYDSMVTSLQNSTFAELMEAQEALIDVYGSFFVRPIVEVNSSQPTFLTELPLDIIKNGSYNQVPIIMGFNSAEEIYTTEIDDFVAYIPGEFLIPYGSDNETIVANKIKTFYFGENGTQDAREAIDLATDFNFAFPTFRTALLQLRTAIYPIYFYLFSADTRLNPSKQSGTVTFPGAAHADELAYIFYMSNTPDNITEGTDEYIDIQRMIDLWTNFAIYSNPTPDNSTDSLIWEPATIDEFYYLELETNSTELATNPKHENFEFWLELYEEYLPPVNEGGQSINFNDK